MELLLSDITLMGAGYCVLGLAPAGADCYVSLRPLPPWGFAWRDPFAYERGDWVRAELATAAGARPHVEDRPSLGLQDTSRSVSQQFLVECLRRAETSRDLEGLFECEVRPSPTGGRSVWVSSEEAQRSVCGCQFQNLRFRLYPEGEGVTIRVQIGLPSGEALQSLPLVDRDWNQLVEELITAKDLNTVQELLNGTVREQILTSPDRHARIGLPRPNKDGMCWLMLDSLFPQPRPEWRADLREGRANGR